MYIWLPHGAHVPFMWCTCDIRVVYICDIHTVYTCHSHGVHMMWHPCGVTHSLIEFWNDILLFSLPPLPAQIFDWGDKSRNTHLKKKKKIEVLCCTSVMLVWCMCASDVCVCVIVGSCHNNTFPTSNIQQCF